MPPRRRSQTGSASIVDGTRTRDRRRCRSARHRARGDLTRRRGRRCGESAARSGAGSRRPAAPSSAQHVVDEAGEGAPPLVERRRALALEQLAEHPGPPQGGAGHHDGGHAAVEQARAHGAIGPAVGADRAMSPEAITGTASSRARASVTAVVGRAPVELAGVARMDADGGRRRRRRGGAPAGAPPRRRSRTPARIFTVTGTRAGHLVDDGPHARRPPAPACRAGPPPRRSSSPCAPGRPCSGRRGRRRRRGRRAPRGPARAGSAAKS